MSSTIALIVWAGSFLIVPIILLFISKFLWKVYLDSFRDEESKLPLPPGSYGWPFIGNTLELIRMEKMSSDFYNQKKRSRGNVYKMHLFGKPMVRVCGENLVGNLLVKDHSNFKSSWMKTVKTLMGPFSLSASPMEVHKERRKPVMQAFTPEALEDYMTHLRVIIEREVKRWTKLPEVMTYEVMEALAFAAASEVVIGLPIDLLDLKKFASDFDDFINGFFTLPLNLPGTPYNKGLKARARMQEALRPFIQDLITGTINREGKIRWSGLDFIMSAHRDNEDQVTESQVLDRILELLFAGHKTVASAATSLVMFLGRNPNIMDKIEKELAQNDIHNLTTDFTYMKLSTLPYLGDVVKETLRLTPPVGAIIRQANKTLEVGGYQIPKGWLVACSINETQEGDNTWPMENRRSFDPDRWNGLDKAYRTRYGYIPFGVGPRICPGRTYADTFLRILAVTLVWECDIELKNPKPHMKRFPVLHPADHLPTNFVRKP